MISILIVKKKKKANLSISNKADLSISNKLALAYRSIVAGKKNS